MLRKVCSQIVYLIKSKTNLENSKQKQKALFFLVQSSTECVRLGSEDNVVLFGFNGTLSCDQAGTITGMLHSPVIVGIDPMEF